MSTMEQFIAWENVRRFRSMLLTDLGSDDRARVQRLLIAEEDKLARDLELIADIERHIVEGGRRIEKQRVVVADMARDGHDRLALAQALLNGLIASQLLHIEYRGRVQLSIEKNPL